MKRFPVLCFALALLSCVAVRGAEKPALNIRIEMQVVSLPEELALPLIDDLMKKEKIDLAYARIQELLAKGTAQLVGWPILTTQEGQRAVIEAIDEIPYATKYSPPVIGFTSDVDTRESVKIEPKVDVTHFEAVPTEFRTRNAGVTMEVEPAVSEDGKTISLNMVHYHVRLKGDRKVTVERPGSGDKIVVEQPVFDSKRVTTSIVVRNGGRVLMGIFRTNEPPKHIELFLLKAEAIPLE